MKLLLDACVLYPTVQRTLLLKAAEAGFYAPYWSERILEEWARAARKLGPLGEPQARAEIALLRAAWPAAELSWPPSLEARLWLPDRADCHVLAAAIAGSCDLIVTANARDFPRGVLRDEGIDRRDPDTLLVEFWRAQPDTIFTICQSVLSDVQSLSVSQAGTSGPVSMGMRQMLKRARLPRLGKALAGAGR